MEKEFVIYSLALRMKKLGYNGSCFAFYQVENFEEKPCGVDDRDEYIRTGFATCKNSEIPEHFTSAPTYSQAFRWFREKYGLSGWVDESFGGGLRRGVISIKSEIGSKYYPTTTKLFYTYEEAELDCLEKLIEIVEQTNAEMTEHGVYK